MYKRQVKISITNEQAKKVKVGDTAELVNYWGDATATLETIGKMCIRDSSSTMTTMQ